MQTRWLRLLRSAGDDPLLTRDSSAPRGREETNAVLVSSPPWGRGTGPQAPRWRPDLIAAGEAGTNHSPVRSSTRIGAPAQRVLMMVAVAAIFLARAAAVENLDFDPAALGKQRSALCLKATHAPLADLESDLNHLAVVSESCRMEYGARACGLAEKSLESDKSEERYAYYVRRPLEAHASAKQIKIDKHNWEAPTTAVARASRP